MGWGRSKRERRGGVGREPVIQYKMPTTPSFPLEDTSACQRTPTPGATARATVCTLVWCKTIQGPRINPGSDYATAAAGGAPGTNYPDSWVHGLIPRVLKVGLWIPRSTRVIHTTLVTSPINAFPLLEKFTPAGIWTIDHRSRGTRINMMMTSSRNIHLISSLLTPQVFISC